MMMLVPVCVPLCHQQWVLGISRSADRHQWLCSVERPGGMSYLFFQEFQLKVDGADIQEAFAEVGTNNNADHNIVVIIFYMYMC